jgi:hypothetical protein
MRVRARLVKLEYALGELLPPGLLDLVAAVPVGCGMTDDLPHGVHFNVDGRVATAVFEGAGPDPAVLAGSEDRLAPSGLGNASLQFRLTVRLPAAVNSIRAGLGREIASASAPG